MAICDRCGNEAERKDCYLFYSSGRGNIALPIESAGINSDFGLLLLCEACTNYLITEDRFQSPGKITVEFTVDDTTETVRPAIFEARDEGIIERCLALGFSPEEAKANAKRLSLLYLEAVDKQTSERELIEFWTADRNDTARKEE